MVGGSIFSTYTLYIAITTIEPNATLDSFRGDWPHIFINYYPMYMTIVATEKQKFSNNLAIIKKLSSEIIKLHYIHDCCSHT